MNRAAYLSRLGIENDKLAADESTLRLLQLRHLLTVPFENLDIHWKRPIILDVGEFYRKIVEGKRGGFCYELNGLFNELLRDIGYKTRLVSARVFNVEKQDFGPAFAHMMIIVSLKSSEYVADVGFGDFIAEPLGFESGIEQTDREGTFTISRIDDLSFKIAKKTGDAWTPECTFEDKSRLLSDFAGMCDFHQYSADSHFTKGKVCSLMTEKGRKTLTDKRFVVTFGNDKTENPIHTPLEFDRILFEEFGIKRN